MTLLGRAFGAALLATFGTFLSVPANAQQKTFYLDRIQISGAPDDGFTVWRPQMHKKTRFYGFAALGYTLNPLRKETLADKSSLPSEMTNPVQGQFITYLQAGAEIAGFLGLNVSLPIGLYQYGGAHSDPGQYARAEVGSGFGLESIALHDVRLDARLPIYHSPTRTFHFGIGGAAWIPTGNEFSFNGDAQLTGYPYAAIEFDFKSFFFAATAGPHFRPPRSIQGRVGNLFIGPDLRWALGAYMPLRQGKYQLGLEVWGTTGISNEHGVNKFLAEQNTDIEWLFQGRMHTDRARRVWVMAGGGTRLAAGYGAPDLRLLISAGYWFPIKDTDPSAPARQWRAPPEVTPKENDRDGDGYPDNIDKCPDIPEDKKQPDPSDGCPAGADRDGDGIPDEADKCPDTPEDKDGVEDTDGCPEKDADNDGIPDQEDKCPTQPGPASKVAEKHGCPQLTQVTADGEIALLEPIQFEFNKATIKPVSFPILDEVVALMKARPKIRVGVYGHTDSQGADAYNLRLSKSRAASCMHYLNDKGIAANRLESEGYGETKPIDSNDTPEGRAKNRRVEFKILNE